MSWVREGRLGNRPGHSIPAKLFGLQHDRDIKEHPQAY